MNNTKVIATLECCNSKIRCRLALDDRGPRLFSAFEHSNFDLFESILPVITRMNKIKEV